MDLIKEHKNSLLSIIIIVAVGISGCYIITLQTDNSSCRAHRQAAEAKNHQLVDEKAQLESSLMNQLQEIKNANQQLHNKNDQINTELQLVKGSNQKLLEENEDFQKKIDQLNAELQLVKDNNQKLLEEKQEFQRKINQINAELRSTKEISQTEQIKLLEKLHQTDSDREVYSTQVMYIQKWMEAIDKLEEHIHAVIYCSESKKERSRYSKSEMCSKIGYKFEESDTDVILITAINMIVKFKEECKPFWNALLLKKVEAMKNLQARTDLNEFGEKMRQINSELSGYKYQQNYEEGKARREASQETAIEKEGFLGKAYKFGVWVGSMIAGLFWS